MKRSHRFMNSTEEKKNFKKQLDHNIEHHDF